jgi:DUF305 family protein family protein
MIRMKENHYRHLGVMAALSFLAMYLLMYAMVKSIGDVYMNFNQVYMAGLMTAPMIVIELFVMRAMYQSTRTNALISVASIVVGLVLFVFIRQQTGVSDQQFLRSMIPHHSAAILMCEDASIQDPRILELCKAITSSQQAEIDQMRDILREPNEAR